MTHSPVVAGAAAFGVADTMEVELTTVAGPFTQDVTTLSRAQRRGEGSTEERPTALLPSAQRRPVPLTMAAITTAAATKTATALGSAQINIGIKARDVSVGPRSVQAIAAPRGCSKAAAQKESPVRSWTGLFDLKCRETTDIGECMGGARLRTLRRDQRGQQLEKIATLIPISLS